MRRPNKAVTGAILLGVGGTAVLLTLGAWQLQRLASKEALIAKIDARLAADPVPVPDMPDPARDQFLRVRVDGDLGAGTAYVLTTRRPQGPGFRVIAPVDVAGRKVLADFGYVPEAEKSTALPAPGTQVSVTGALFWPESRDSYTPEPDLARKLWFIRDTPGIAAALDTEPVLIVAERHSLGERPLAERIAHNLPNDHLGYALTWFSLAAICALMSFLWGRSAREQRRD